MWGWRVSGLFGAFALAALAPATGWTADAGGSCSIAFGAYIDGVPASLDPLTQLEGRLGQPAAIVHWSQGWQPDANPTLDEQQLRAVRGHGAWPFISWLPEAVPLADILAGGWDEYIDRWATTLADYGDPVFLAPMPGLDDARHSYAWNATGNREADLVAVWRRLHDRFANAGANNVLWVFEVAGQPDAPLVRLYPGDPQVDWVALEAYNGGTAPDRPWTPLVDLVSPVYEQLQALSRDKPVMLSEFGSVEAGGDKAQWLRDAGRDLPARFPQIKAVVAFDSVDLARPAADWRLETSPESLAAAHDAFGPGTAYCLTAGELTGDSLAGPGGPLRRTLSLAIPLLALTLLFGLGVAASKLPRPHG
jgi:hypothetical protein